MDLTNLDGKSHLVLQKGGFLNLSKTGESLNNLTLEANWDASNTYPAYDLDLIANILKDGVLKDTQNGDGCMTNENTIYFNNRKLNGLELSEDNRIGGGDGESIKINLSKVDSDVSEIILSIFIFEATKKKQVFNMVKNAYVRLINNDTGQEIVRFNLTDEYATDTGVITCSLSNSKSNNEWFFNAKGIGVVGDDINSLASYF